MKRLYTLVALLLLTSNAMANDPCGCRATPSWFTQGYDKVTQACPPACDQGTCFITTGIGQRFWFSCYFDPSVGDGINSKINSLPAEHPDRQAIESNK